MGNCSLPKSSPEPILSLSRKQFQVSHAVGKGAFGKVWQVTHKKTKGTYAMKMMLKTRVVAKRSVHSVMNERRLLAALAHPFLINMQFAFQDRENLYLIMDYLSGGDLRFHLGKRRTFTEEQTKFYICCLLAALEYLHSKGVIHRDVKPENLVLDFNGYLRLTDLGVAREVHLDNASETSGTPGYMAPEVLCRQNHAFPVDLFAVGVIVYEFMMGKRPYLGANRKEIREAVLAKQVQVTSEELPNNWSWEAADFCNKMIQRKPANRLGCKGIAEVKQHPWLGDFPFEKLYDRTIKAPFVPSSGDNFSGRQVNCEWKDQAVVATIKSSAITSLFPGYFYDSTGLT